jgi:hypothetical protein
MILEVVGEAGKAGTTGATGVVGTGLELLTKKD